MKAQSRKEALARTVRLLTKEGTAVTFRGATPFVAADASTGKVVRLNLPEIPDEAPALLVDALQGYLDHEVGHIFYTPFDKTPDRRVDPERGVFANIFEDIRLEKLLPRDLPGTRDNLERMYVNWIPLIVQPGLDAIEKQGDQTRMISALLMPMMRALGGQQVFQKLMDDKGYWAVVEPLMQRLPGFGAQVAAMETYDDVLACVERLKVALTPPPPPPAPPAPPETEPAPEQDNDPSDDGEGSGEDDSDGTNDDEDNEPGDDAGDDETDDGEEGSPGETEEDDDDAGDDSDAAGDDNADATEEGDGAGDDPADDAGADEPGDSDGDEGEPEAGSEPGDEPVSDAERDRDERDDGDDDDGELDQSDAEDDAAPGDGGKRNRTMTEALGLLDPTLRRALFLHKKRKRSVSEIASEMNVSGDRVEEMLREARRGLAKLMKE